MQFTQTIIAAIFAASTAYAAPTAASATSMAAAAPEWSFLNFQRVCNSDDTSCTWTFGVNENKGNPDHACKFVVTGSTASQRAGGPAACDDYTITSGWSGQFGPGNGFTTLAVVNNRERLIAYPAYTDKELASGKPVSPNRKYPAQNLPSL